VIAVPRVSVVMPVFRPDPVQLGEAIDSILSQTLRDWELVIVEDPSNRVGAKVVQQRSDPRIRYILNSVRTGLAHQHNCAVRETRANYIARFDADDISESARLERQADFLDGNPTIDVVSSQMTIIDRGGRETGSRTYPLLHDEIVAAMHRYNPISGSNVMFRRNVVDTVGGWREDVDRPAQDYEWYSRVAARGFRFATYPERLVRYRRHEGQIKRRKLRGTILTTLEVKRRYWLRTMDAGGLALMCAEALALGMPGVLVLWMLERTRYD
jgi:glycosyltransferase involved in cell wall biosynthesis